MFHCVLEKIEKMFALSLCISNLLPIAFCCCFGLHRVQVHHNSPWGFTLGVNTMKASLPETLAMVSRKDKDNSIGHISGPKIWSILWH